MWQCILVVRFRHDHVTFLILQENASESPLSDTAPGGFGATLSVNTYTADITASAKLAISSGAGPLIVQLSKLRGANKLEVNSSSDTQVPVFVNREAPLAWQMKPSGTSWAPTSSQ